MNKNDEVILRIEDLTAEGEGIGRADGFALFVKDTIIGDLARVRIMKIKKTYGFARLLEIIAPSPYRVDPKCELAIKCGGCQLQHCSYEKQLEYKADKVKNCLQRIGKLANVPMEPIIGMEQPYYYRNKAQFPVGRDKEGKLAIGFYAGRTHSIIDTAHCAIQAPVNEELIHIIRSFLDRFAIEPYDEAGGKGLVRHILTRIAYTTGEIMVCLILNGERLPHAEELVERLHKVEGMTSITINVNKERTNVILGKEIRNLWGQDYITDYIGDICYQISPLSFYQVNPVQTKKLYETALEYADLHGKEIVWDLYCGIGTISLFLAQKAKQVYGVEIVPEAIEDAKRNAALNGITNAEFFTGAAEDVLPEQYAKSNDAMRANVIVVDPPRKGCDETLLETICKMEPDRIVYVSCDPATLARDVHYLAEHGYEVKRVRACDMFPMTSHVETVVLLSQQKPSDRIEVDLDLDELDVTSAEMKATYAEIKDYVLKEHGLKVSNLYISQVKKKCGLEVGENYNLAKSEDAKQPNCPEEKEKAIVDALKYFGMVS